MLRAALLLGLVVSARAAEFTYNSTYSGTAYTTKVFHDDAIPPGGIQGVIVAFNYGGADQAYSLPIWRNFAKDRNLALCLMLNQDTLGIPANVTDGASILNATLGAAATGLGRPELSANTLPLIFVGISRGGTSGAINFGWHYGANRTVACLAYHGNSFNYLNTAAITTGGNTSGRAGHSIPVLYTVAQLDSGPFRQTDIETAVRTKNSTTLNGSISATVFGYRPNYGLFWTTAMQYGSSHASLGDDTYPLQWLGRVWSARYNAATPGTLTAISTGASVGGTYTLTNGASSTAAFASPATAAFAQKDTNIWLLATGAGEWIAENAPPLAATPYNIDSAQNTIYTAPDRIENRAFINSGSITFSGNGTVQLDNGVSGNKNYFNMTGGTLFLRNGVTLRNGNLQNAVWTNNSARLDLDATSTLDLWDGNPVRVGALTGAGTVLIGLTTGNQTLTVGAGNSTGTFTGLIAKHATGTSSLALVKTGTGTQTLTGANTYTGGTTVSQGTLSLTGSGTLGSGNLSVSDGATCALANLSGAVADTATIALGATGKLDLAAGLTERVAALTINGVAMAKGVWNALRDPARFTGVGQLLVVTPGSTALQDWRLAYFNTTANSGSAADNADPDGDGLLNLLEYGLGTSPLSPGASPAVTNLAGGSLALTYRRNHAAVADGLGFVVETSDTLGNDWTTAGVTQSLLAGTDDGFGAQWRATVAAPSNGKRFLRLRVTSP